MLPRFEPAGRCRPVDLVAPIATVVDLASPGPSSEQATPQPAPYAAVVVELGSRSVEALVELTLAGDGVRLTGTYDGRWTALGVSTPASTTRHRSRRDGRPPTPVDALALTLTGTHLTVLTRADGVWTARGRVDLATRAEPVDTRDESWLATLRSGHRGVGVTRLLAGGFGQLGLRDLRLVTHASGAPYVPAEGGVLLSATSAGPGFFDTAHTSVWALDPEQLTLTHRADLFFRRPDSRSGRPGAFGDHATHLVRHEGGWLVATSTWGDFESRRPGATVGVTLARSPVDLTTGRHVLDARPLLLPTDGLASVGVWDPHLVHTGSEWLVGFVSARKFFRFHPALAGGPDLGALTLRGAATERSATEGTTLHRLAGDDGSWHVLASDGPAGRLGQREAYPVFDLTLTQVGELDAPYPTNIPWPTLLRTPACWLMVGFDGRSYGGRLVGYGTHGDVVFSRGPVPSTT